MTSWLRLRAVRAHAACFAGIAAIGLATPATHAATTAAVPPLEAQAEAGEVAAQRELGRRLLASEAPEERKQAERWLLAAAEAGDADAQAALAAAYSARGQLPRSPAAALQWAQTSAEQGHPTGQYLLGAAYFSGTDLGKDAAQAMAWFEKAALQGHPGAQYSLAIGYARGVGVERDYMRAYSWLVLCSPRLPSANAAKREVARRLSGAQMEQAGLDARRIEKEIRARHERRVSGR